MTSKKAQALRMKEDQARLRKMQQQRSVWHFISFDTLFIFALIGLLTWLITRSVTPPETTVAAGVTNESTNAANGGTPKRQWVMYVVYAALGVLGVLLVIAVGRFVLRKPDHIIGFNDVDNWMHAESKKLKKNIKIVFKEGEGWNLKHDTEKDPDIVFHAYPEGSQYKLYKQK